MLAGLAAPDGRLVSVLAGVRAGNHLHLLSQFNDESLDRSNVSPSLVLRGYLIEHLIPQGIASIHFVNGTSAALGRFCDPVLMRTISIDSRRSVLHPAKLVDGPRRTPLAAPRPLGPRPPSRTPRQLHGRQLIIPLQPITLRNPSTATAPSQIPSCEFPQPSLRRVIH